MTKLCEATVIMRLDLSALPTAPNPAPVALEAAPAPATIDPRSLANTAAHVERPVPARAWTKASAAKFRRDTAKACGCRLCALAINPPVTFSEYEVFMGSPSPSAIKLGGK